MEHHKAIEDIARENGLCWNHEDSDVNSDQTTALSFQKVVVKLVHIAVPCLTDCIKEEGKERV